MSTSGTGDYYGSDRIGPSAHADAKTNMHVHAHLYSHSPTLQSFHFSCLAGELSFFLFGPDENGFGSMIKKITRLGSPSVLQKETNIRL